MNWYKNNGIGSAMVSHRRGQRYLLLTTCELWFVHSSTSEMAGLHGSEMRVRTGAGRQTTSAVLTWLTDLRCPPRWFRRFWLLIINFYGTIFHIRKSFYRMCIRATDMNIVHYVYGVPMGFIFLESKVFACNHYFKYFKYLFLNINIQYFLFIKYECLM